MVIVNDSLNDLLSKIVNVNQVLSESFFLSDRFPIHDSVISSPLESVDYISSSVLEFIICRKTGLNRLNDYFPIVTINEAVCNAIAHGHCNDLTKGLHVTVYSGDNGWLVQLTDSGSGFDYKRVNSERRSVYQGNGFACYRAPGITVSFMDEGRTINIQGFKNMN